MQVSPSPYRFSRRVDNYIKYRPHYPTALLDVLQLECGLTNAHIVADIGSGTGILSELFLAHGNLVFGIEPDPNMRSGGEHYLRTYPHFRSIAATAEATTLANHSVDFVTAGQAFHWFDHRQARDEFARILRPGGWVVLVWNLHRTIETPFLAALEEFWLKNFTSEEPQNQATDQVLSSCGERTKAPESLRLRYQRARQEIIAPFFMHGVFREKVLSNPLICDWDGLKGRVLSARIPLEDPDPRLTTMLEELGSLYQTYQIDGKVTIEQDTHMIYGQL
jgi:SAM-dependent methyltransferase